MTWIYTATLLPEVFEEVREKVLLNEEELDVESLLFGSSQTMEGRDNNEAQMYQSYSEMVVTKKSRKTKKAK